MLHLLFAAALVAAPAPTPQAKIAAYILRINPQATPYASKLATRIIAEARAHRLTVPMLVAIAHTESHFRLDCKGRAYEYGIWQLWPRGKFMAPLWARLRFAQGRVTGWPRKRWFRLTRKQRQAAARDLEISTWMAAAVLAYHVRRCGRHSPRCGARYNSGRARVALGYFRVLTLRMRAVRRVLGMPPRAPWPRWHRRP